MIRPSHRRLLVCLLLVASFGLGGCLTLNPTVSANTHNSTVFESFSTDDSWATGRIKASIVLAPNATTSQGVSKLTVIDETGTQFDTASVSTGQIASGQTSLTTLYLPANQNVTVNAVNTTSGNTIETRTVETGGNEVF